MKPTTITLLYWICTILFSGMMIFTAIGGIGPNEQTREIFVNGLGYPVYFIRFISWAKIIGSIAILLPGLKTLKEWAYAGLFFDLAGAIYSGIAVSGKFDPLMLTMLFWIGPGILSYIFWKKKLEVHHLS